MRKETDTKTYVSIRDWQDPTKPKSTPKPKFFIGDKVYATIGGMINGVMTEKKKITPKEGTNKGKEITVHNLLVEITDEDGDMTLQIPLYSQIARNVINSLAGPYPFDKEYFFNVYKNKMDYRTISIKDNDTIDSNYIEGKYSFEEINAMVETKMDKGEEKKDYDGLMDKLITELMPIIENKLGNTPQIIEEVEEENIGNKLKEKSKKDIDNSDLPF